MRIGCDSRLAEISVDATRRLKASAVDAGSSVPKDSGDRIETSVFANPASFNALARRGRQYQTYSALKASMGSHLTSADPGCAPDAWPGSRLLGSKGKTKMCHRSALR
jgi:hypothetical protein